MIGKILDVLPKDRDEGTIATAVLGIVKGVDGIDHAIASKELAERILIRYDLAEIEGTKILTAIKGHRKKDESSPLADILYRADKFSRNCVLCNARKTCKKFQNGEDYFLFY